ncbi:MAG: zinc-binding dehydrogenase [Planctomycetota bacterium]|jgi:threonine dehydrogenase-like Zn-dependent dehydrogenase|nr:zinc-binding dehydrogenase [Planctomycetota bacterium]
MRAIAIEKPNQMTLVDVPKPTIGPYDALVKTEVNFICNATDRKLVDGHFPGIGPEGYPMLVGHENSGIVEEVGAKAASFKPGDRVIGGLIWELDAPYKFGWGGASDYVVARDHLAMVAGGVADEAHGWSDLYQIMKKVPRDIQPDAAGLLCTWREVYAAFTDFNLKPEYRILVFGAGPVGLSFIAFAKNKGFTFVACVEPQRDKHALAKRLGADAVYVPDQDFVREFEKDAGEKADAVIDAVGNTAITNASLPLLKLGASMCVYGVIADAAMVVDKGKGPLNFNLLVHQWPTRTLEAAAQEPLIEWIRTGKLKAEDFVTGRFPVADFEKAFAASRAPGAIKTMIVFN